jgi:hypothetical protein
LTPLGQLLPALLPQLLEQGFAEFAGQSVKIPFDQFIRLANERIHAFEELAPWAPFFIELSTSGILGKNDFTYKINYYHGRDRVTLDRLGCFVKHLDKIYQFDLQSYSLIAQIDHFRRLSSEEKTSPESLLCFASIRGLAEGVGAQIDRFIKDNKVLIPPTLGIDLVKEEDGRVSFVPFIEGIPQEALRRVFLQSEDVTNLHIDDGAGGRIRLVFSPDQQEALKRMAKVRHISGVERVAVLRNPDAVFDGVASAVDLELGNFGPRVRAIGSFPAIAQPVIRNSGTGVFSDDILPVQTNKGGRKFDVGILCKYADGSEETLRFENKDQVFDFNRRVQSSFAQGSGTVELNGRSLVVDREFAFGVRALARRITGVSPQPRALDNEDDRRYLLIFENEKQLEYREKSTLDRIDQDNQFVPKALKEGFLPKPHQIEGLRWLQHNYLLRRGGCLLADDMGLGKTVQVLMFIAWLIERGDISPSESTNPEAAPWDPILIVSPTILLENQTWIQDMKKFFKHDGAIFDPCHILYKRGIGDMRIAGSQGQETLVMQALLDSEKLRRSRIILTNYETLVNYQFSFASLKSGWTAVVTDEAQSHKTPKSKRSFALKSMSPRFRVACTGTPVETRLLDVWNIIDYLQPGELLGNSQEFTKTYEQPLSDSPEQAQEILASLRDRLNFGQPDSYILRREKSQVLDGLPFKYEHKIVCLLSEEQRQRHIEYIKSVRESEKKGVHLSVIQSLMELYQHPSIVPVYEPFPQGQLERILALSPKLTEMLNVLRRVKAAGEKALIFTRSIDMQQLLSLVILESFGQRVDIVNGAAKRGGDTLTSINTRKGMLKRFQTETNVNFIVLSPDVAGVGLTLVEANHVIHYGRWWNPAKESQATDRVYRIGQERDVHVYYLIAKDPRDEFKSFDEKLDALIERRKKMASDFLLPLPEEGEVATEFYREIFGDSPTSSEQVIPLTLDDIRTISWDRYESLIGHLEIKAGRRSVVTPRGGDMGIDVVSIQGDVARLIQCKHTRCDAEIDPDVIDETINAFDTYRAHFFTDGRFTLKPVLATNGKVSKSLAGQCLQRGIEVMDSTALTALLTNYPSTFADVELCEAARLNSIANLRAWLLQR